MSAKKIISREEARQVASQLKQAGRRVVFTNGCFDLLHRGHIELLAFAKGQGDVLFVGLNTDDSVRRLKGAKRPINNQTDRALVLAALESVDYVVLFNEDTPLELITELLPDILVKGGDYRLDTIVGRDVVERNGGQVCVFPLLEGYSTTAILDRDKTDSEKTL